MLKSRELHKHTHKNIVTNWMFYAMWKQLLLITDENKMEDYVNKRQRQKRIAKSIFLPCFLLKIVKQSEYSVKY